jgi:hypothetical protein
VRLAGPQPLPPASPATQRKVSSRGAIRVARQRVQVGLPHAGRIVSTELGDTTLRVTDPDGELPTTVPRTSTGEITRFKAHGSQALSLTQADKVKSPEGGGSAAADLPGAQNLAVAGVRSGPSGAATSHAPVPCLAASRHSSYRWYPVAFRVLDNGRVVDRMARFRAYAKVLEPDDPTMRIYEAGLRACPGEPGMPLAEVLRRSGGAYHTTTPLIPHMRDDIREVAELTSDAELLKIAELTEVPVSLEHLRGLDPQTRIIIRSELNYEGDEASRVSAGTRPRHPLATVMPDGTVIPGDARPLGRLFAS